MLSILSCSLEDIKGRRERFPPFFLPSMILSMHDLCRSICLSRQRRRHLRHTQTHAQKNLIKFSSSLFLCSPCPWLMRLFQRAGINRLRARALALVGSGVPASAVNKIKHTPYNWILLDIHQSVSERLAMSVRSPLFFVAARHSISLTSSRPWFLWCSLGKWGPEKINTHRSRIK